VLVKKAKSNKRNILMAIENKKTAAIFKFKGLIKVAISLSISLLQQFKVD
jgi:hypothetical protein